MSRNKGHSEIILPTELVKEKRQEISEKKNPIVNDALKKLIFAETNYRFMVQLCFMQPYQSWMMDETMQLQMLDWKVAQRLRAMMDEIKTLRINAFGSNK